jgi:hypothetical protein
MKIPIAQALQALNLPVKNGMFSCPSKAGHANGDAKPSAGIPEETRWHCFACGAHGDAIDLVTTARGINFAEACRFLGHKPERNESKATRHPVEKNPAEPWPKLRDGTDKELQALATLRGWDFYTLARMSRIEGVLRFTSHKGAAAWTICDNESRALELRRLDGKLWHGERKVHCLPGGEKSWPLGTGIQPAAFRDSAGIVLVEGLPDMVAAAHLLERAGQAAKAYPVAMLGAGVKLCAEAARHLAGHPVIIWAQDDGPGHNAAEVWAGQIEAEGGAVAAIVPHDGGDIDDWLQTGPSREAITAALPWPKKTPVENETEGRAEQ